MAAVLGHQAVQQVAQPAGQAIADAVRYVTSGGVRRCRGTNDDSHGNQETDSDLLRFHSASQ